MKMKKIRINIDITIDDKEKKVYRVPECSKRTPGSDFDLDKVIEDSLNKDDAVKSTINKIIIAFDKLKEIL